MRNLINKYLAKLRVKRAKRSVEACQELFVEGTWKTTDTYARKVYNTAQQELTNALKGTKI